MVADLLDLTARARVDFANANRGEKTPLQPYPEPVWRPEKPGAAKRRKEKARREAAEARQGYQRIVAIATPQHADRG
ncbi:hypothetical protein AB0M23_30790 [Streptomyces sp. NPDC052077]|uniref:hypothetical protein n=1 Tax=Streptomyces sp. NPDC052077 TaxID=3154757 RepID=UPI00342FB039